MGSKTPFPTTPVARLTGHNGPVHAVTFSAGTGQFILTGCQDRQIRLFNPNTSSSSSSTSLSSSSSSRQLIQTFSAHGYEVLDIAVAHDNASFASVGGDKTVFLWDVATARTTRRFNGHAARINTVALGGANSQGSDGGDCSVIVTGSYDGTVKLWDTKARADHRPIMTFSEARDSISSIAVVDSEIFVGSVDGCVRVYDIAMGHVDVDVVAPGKGVTSVCPSLSIASSTSSSQDGSGVGGYLVSSLDSSLRFIDRSGGKALQTLKDTRFTNKEYRIRSTLAMSDAYAISGSENGSVFVWDMLSGKVVHQLLHKEVGPSGVGTQSKKDVVSAVTWNQLRKQWATAGGDGSVVVWANPER